MLKGMTWDHPRGYAGLEAASEHYRSEHGISISWDRRSLQAFADASISKLAEAYDLIVLDHPHVGQIADTACLHPLPDPDDTARCSLGGSLESYVWRDRLWAYPVDAACQMAVKRPDLCKQELPDWEAVLDDGKNTYRIVTALLPVDACCMLMTLVAGRGEEVLPYSKEEFVSEENGMLALKILKALYKLGPTEAVSWNPIKVLEAMATTDDCAYSPCLFGYINYARPGFRPNRLDYADLPSVRAFRRNRPIWTRRLNSPAGSRQSLCSRASIWKTKASRRICRPGGTRAPIRNMQVFCPADCTRWKMPGPGRAMSGSSDLSTMSVRSSRISSSRIRTNPSFLRPSTNSIAGIGHKGTSHENGSDYRRQQGIGPCPD